MASPAIFKGRLTKFLTNGGILIPARPQTTDASAVPTPGELAYDTENENFVVYQNGNWEVVAVFSDLIASNIVNTPYGDIEAVDVQSALNELDDDKVAREGDSLSGNLTFANNTGIESTVDESTINVGTTSFSHNVNIGTGSHTSSVNIGTGTGVTTINIGGAGDTVNIGGELVYVEVSDLQVQDKEIIVNVGGAAGSSESAGLHVEEDGVIVGLNHVANNRQSWEFKAPANEGSILVTPTLADTSTNIVASSTVDRTITLPDTSDTLATQTQIDDVNDRIDELTTDDVPESAIPTNLYFTDARAKAAAVVNSVAGDQNDQAPSVTSIVTYVNTQINALDTDDIEEGATNQYFTVERAQDAAWGAIDAGTNVAGNPITATYDDDNNKIELLVNDAAISNAKLANSSVTLNGTEISLGESDFVGIYNENVSTSGTLSPNTRVMVNTSGGAITLTLPVGAEDAYIELKDAVGSWDSNNLTVAPAAGEKINGLGIDETLVCDVREGWLSFAWDVANSRWNLSTTAAINLNDIEASSISPGIVSITDQEFAGVKTFTDGILLAPNTTPAINPTAGLQVYAKSDNKLYTLNSDGIEQAVGSGGSIILIDQVAHGFVAADVGRPVYLNGSSYEFAQADTEAKAEVAGLISRIINVDQFEICLGGEVGSVGGIVDVSNRTYARSFVQGSYSGFLFSRYLLDKLLQPENIVFGTATYLADGLNDILISTPGNVAPAMDNPLTEDPDENTNNNLSSVVFYYNNTQYSVVPPIELWKVNFSVNGGVLTLDSFGEPGAFNPYFAFPIIVPDSSVSGYFVIAFSNNKSSISLTLSSDINPSDEMYYALEYPLEGAQIASLYQSPIPQISMESGQNYFLSPTTPGALVSESPSVVGQISKPVGIARTTSAIDFFNMRGSSVGGSNVYTQISLANATTTTVQNVSAYDSVELAGWVYINATSPYRFHFKAQVTKNGAATDYLISYQTSGDTPPSGFSLSVTSAGIVQAVLPSVSGFSSALAQFSLNGPAVGASLPLQIDSDKINIVESAPLSNRNVLINGNFDIWQRGTSQTSNGYGSDDRWNNLNNGSTKTHSQQAFALGQTEVPGNPKYFSRTVVSSVAGASNYVIKQQRIESVTTLAGQTATLSFWARADAPKNMAVEFEQAFATGGSPSAPVDAIGVTTIALTTSWKKYTVTVDIPSIAGKTLGTNGDDALRLLFWFDAGSNWDNRTNSLGQQSGTFDIAQVQLEAGSKATAFEKRPYGTELQLCQRYYEQWTFTTEYSQISLATVYSNNFIAMVFPYKVTKRGIPSSWSASSGTFNYFSGVDGTILNLSVTEIYQPGVNSARVRLTSPTSLTNGSSGFVISEQGTSKDVPAYIGISAEL